MNNIEDEDVENIKLEESQDVSTSGLPPTFKGRLNITDYSFNAQPSIKSEPDLSLVRTLRSGSTAIQQSPKPSLRSAKRKATSKLSQSPSPRKKSRSPAGYAPPSTYAHLPELQDVLTPNLLCVFIGLNPGIQTATQGHAYAHPSNRFWKLLHSSGLTTHLCRPDEDGDLPRLFQLGNTNIVSRPTRNGAELSKQEMDGSVKVLEEKIAKWRPESVAVVGKSIWESLWRVRHGRKITKEEFRYGWQDEGERLGVVAEDGEGGEWKGARIFVATSTSGLAANIPYHEKEIIWRELGAWVETRKLERAASL